MLIIIIINEVAMFSNWKACCFVAISRMLYPITVAIGITITTYPAVLGQFMASKLTAREQVRNS